MSVVNEVLGPGVALAYGLIEGVCVKTGHRSRAASNSFTT